MYDFMYWLFPSFAAALVSSKGRENFLLILFPFAFVTARLYPLLRCTDLISEPLRLERAIPHFEYTKDLSSSSLTASRAENLTEMLHRNYRRSRLMTLWEYKRLLAKIAGWRETAWGWWYVFPSDKGL
jgi:hypothetical protein